LTANNRKMIEQQEREEGPVTVSVSRKAIAGKEKEYEDWISGITQSASKYPGHMGSNVLRPSDATKGEYVIIYRFDNYPNACRWEESKERSEWLEKVKSLVQGEAVRRKVTGFEFWFDLPSVPVTHAPSRQKMAVVMVIVVYMLVLSLSTLMAPIIGDFAFWQKLLVIIPMQVILMTYVVMPRVTKLLKSWLYASS
jgi:uncharacterized protein